MIQTIITLLIIGVAAFLVLKNTFWKTAAQKEDACGGCASSCGSCSVASLKNEIKPKA
ncbi:MAG: FeoB-associated Cys-rich membrane protein [Bacteroidota bacterium]